MANNNTPFQLFGYSFIDGKFTWNGVELLGIRSCKIEATQEKTNKHGAGPEPISRGKKQREYSGSIDLDIETRQIIIDNFAPNLLMLDVPAGVFAATFNNGNRVITISVPFSEFNSDGIDVSVGDDEVVSSYEMICGKPRII